MTKKQVEQFIENNEARFNGNESIEIVFKDGKTDSIDPVWGIEVVEEEVQIENGAHKYGYIYSTVAELNLSLL